MNLNLYLKRIDFREAVRVDVDTLKQLHLKHATRIPFENLDIQLGRPISLDLEALERKMVQNDRGGYCFEQNTLLQAELREAGFDVIACEARVRMGRSMVTSRTHMLLIVKLNQRRFLADVGFGGDGLLLPVPLDGEEHAQYLWKYRVVQENELLVLQILRTTGWMDLYAFYPRPCDPVDFEVANWFTSTHPDSRFVQTLTVQLPTAEARYILRNKTFVIERGGKEVSRELHSREELLGLLEHKFRLRFPANTRFRNPDFSS